MDFLLYNPYKYDPKFFMAQLKGNKQPGSADHESRPAEERLANRHSMEKVQSSIVADKDPGKATVEAFNPPLPGQPGVPAYYILYRLQMKWFLLNK